MAEDKDLQTKLDIATYEENPLEFCKGIFAEADKRNHDLAATNKENRKFYEGEDEELEKRKRDKDVERSSLFIHEVKPAIDTRVSESVTSVEETEFPITFRPADDQYGPPAPGFKDHEEQALWIARTINRQLRECGYLSRGFEDHLLSSEIYRSPSAVKVGWENVYEKRPQATYPSELEKQMAVSERRLPPTPQVRFVDAYVGGRPYVELLAPDEFLYQPLVSDIQREADYSGHAIWVPYHKLVSLAKEYEWDEAKIKALKDELPSDDTEQDAGKSFEEEFQGERDEGIDTGFRDGKILVAELYVKTMNDAGEDVMRQIIMVANKLLVSDKVTPYRGILHPFVATVANRFPGTIEGLSSIDVAKYMQRLYNELFNSYLDGLSYRLFSPLILEVGSGFAERPKWKLGAIWKMINSEGLRPLIDNPGAMPDLPPVMEAVSGKIREVLNAHDISQGFQAQEYEKATSTRLRASGAAKRSMPLKKQHGEVLVSVARMVLALNQQYHEEKHKFVMNCIVDVPSLTAVSDPERDKQEALLILELAAGLPLFGTPNGERKIRNMFEDMLHKFKKINIEKFVPSEEEHNADLEAKKQMMLAELQKQATGEQLALSGGEGGVPVQ